MKIFIYAVIAYLTCPDTMLVNKTEVEFNLKDLNILRSSRITCRERYPDSPCVKIFEKCPENHYNVICAKEGPNVY